MQTQATQKEVNYKMSRLDEYRLWAMICDNELNADLQSKGQGMAIMSGSQADGSNDMLSMRRARMAN
jgi:hypothetical protein